MRNALLGLTLAALLFDSVARAQGDGGYRLVPNWPTLPAEMFFGLKEAPPQPGISGLAIDAQDRIYVFNRGAKPVLVFDTAGALVLAGGDQAVNGKTINPSWQHSGAVDWDGNVYIIERDAHRIVKLSPKLDTFLLQIGTTGERGNDQTHLDLPSGISVLRSGNTSSSPTGMATTVSCCSTRTASS